MVRNGKAEERMMRVLVVGGAGYVGGALVDELLKLGHHVCVYDKLLYENRYLKQVDFIYGDVRELPKLKTIAKDFDAVIWLAALVGDPLCALNPKITREINQEIPQDFAESFAGKFVFMSTCSIYGAQDGLLNEESPKNPLSLYAETKLASENEILAQNPNALVLRLGTLFGISDSHARLRADLVLNLLVMRAVYAKEVTVFGGEQFRPLLHVRDVGLAIIAGIDADASGAFNLHCDNVTIVELAKKIVGKFPEVKLTITEQSFQDSRNYAVSSDKARASFGFNPIYSVDFGITEVGNSLKVGRFPRILDPSFSNADMMRQTLLLNQNPLVREVYKN
jgi:nucleoside-diphosphate-sugar epimerase